MWYILGFRVVGLSESLDSFALNLLNLLISMKTMLSWCRPSLTEDRWAEFSITKLKISVQPPEKDAFPGRQISIPPHFWSTGLQSRSDNDGELMPRYPFPVHGGYLEARDLIGNGTVADLKMLSNQARSLVKGLFRGIGVVSVRKSEDHSLPESYPRLVQLRLSPELERWKMTQRAVGNVLPPKGTGLSQVSAEVVQIYGAEGWPEALKTNNALFGCGMASLLMGAADVQTMFSNYVTDMVFYWEHGFNHVFPSLEPLLWKGLNDPQALRTLGGTERREAVRIGKEYIQTKITLENRHKTHLKGLSARLDRRSAQIVSLSESSLLGMAAEATTRGFDPGSVMSDLVFSSPGTDVLDVGCDLVNSEVMNSFLNVTNITDMGIISEEVLRKVYDAYAAVGARTLTQRWHEPAARMCALLYTWHIQNDRHMFFRRAILGWPKARKTSAQPQCEADFDEAFDEQYRVTGFTRPLDPEYACNGEDTCDHVHNFLKRSREKVMFLALWWSLVVGPLEYVRGGQIDERREAELNELSRLRMAELYSHGFVLGMVWLVAHANHHAWQVNYLFEAAMFGSILDGETLAGKLDRREES